MRFLLYDDIKSSGIALNLTDHQNVNFNSSKETVFLVHGWSSHHTSPMAQTVKDAYLITREINVIIVDWKDLALSRYHFSKLLVLRVGRILGSFIEQMTEILSLNLDKTSIVGFSLGAHIAAVAGRIVGGKLDHITGKFSSYFSRRPDRLEFQINLLLFNK